MSYLPRIETTKTLRAFSLTAGQLREFLDGVDDEATVDVATDRPDRPGERTTTTVRVTEARSIGEQP